MGATIAATNSTEADTFATCDIIVAASALPVAVRDAMERKQLVLHATWLEGCWSKICKSLEDFNVTFMANRTDMQMLLLSGCAVFLDEQMWKTAQTRT